MLLSADGIAKFGQGLDIDGADELSAVASGLDSLSQGVGIRFGGEGVCRVVAGLGEAILFVMALAFFADREERRNSQQGSGGPRDVDSGRLGDVEPVACQRDRTTSMTQSVAHNVSAVEQLRSHVLRVAVITMVIVAILAVGGILAAAALSAWVLLIGGSVAVFSIAGILIASSMITSAVRTHEEWLSTVAPLRPSMFDGDPGQRREVFGKLARRLQSLVNRAIQRVDDLEREIEDPELLHGLYEIDHLATRVRRQAENLAVLGGDTPQRRSTQPVTIYAVLRSAVAEIEHYKQVSIVPLEGASLQGHAVAEIIHLLAELLENATTFTPPHAPKVVLRAYKVTAGLAIEIQDRGLGMTLEDLQRINHLLDGTATIDLAEQLSDGRIGLAVVKELARRHDIRVQWKTNIFGGIDVDVVLPHALLGESFQEASPAQASVVPQPAEPQPQPAQPQPKVVHQPLRQPVPRPVQQPGWEAKPAAASSVNAWNESSSGQRTEYPGYPPTQQPQALPVRTAGNSTLRPAGESRPAASPEGGLPPLPQRRGSYLRSELLQAPEPTRPVLGHDTNLMAVVQQGFDRARDVHETEEQQSLAKHRTTEGESEPWPTT